MLLFACIFLFLENQRARQAYCKIEKIMHSRSTSEYMSLFSLHQTLPILPGQVQYCVSIQKVLFFSGDFVVLKFFFLIFQSEKVFLSVCKKHNPRKTSSPISSFFYTLQLLFCSFPVIVSHFYTEWKLCVIWIIVRVGLLLYLVHVFLSVIPKLFFTKHSSGMWLNFPEPLCSLLVPLLLPSSSYPPPDPFPFHLIPISLFLPFLPWPAFPPTLRFIYHSLPSQFRITSPLPGVAVLFP